MAIEWTCTLYWHLEEADVSFGRAPHGAGWICFPAIRYEALFSSYGIPQPGGIFGFGFGPFPSLSTAASIAAGVCGCSPRRRQDRIYTVEGIPVQIFARRRPSRAAGENPRIYTMGPAFPHIGENYIVEGAVSTWMSQAVRRRWGYAMEDYDRLSDAQRAVEQWIMEQRRRSLALLGIQARTAASRRFRRASSTGRGRRRV